MKKSILFLLLTTTVCMGLNADISEAQSQKARMLLNSITTKVSQSYKIINDSKKMEQYSKLANRITALTVRTSSGVTDKDVSELEAIDIEFAKLLS